MVSGWSGGEWGKLLRKDIVYQNASLPKQQASAASPWCLHRSRQDQSVKQTVAGETPLTPASSRHVTEALGRCRRPWDRQSLVNKVHLYSALSRSYGQVHDA